MFSSNVLFNSLSRDNAENMHYFSSLALTLNEPEEGVAPTDSRLRPDQRLMEAGLWDEANVQKQRLEECQRLDRKKREAQANQALEESEYGEQGIDFAFHFLHNIDNSGDHYRETILYVLLECPSLNQVYLNNQIVSRELN